MVRHFPGLNLIHLVKQKLTAKIGIISVIYPERDCFIIGIQYLITL